jgi:hypothetical protein
MGEGSSGQIERACHWDLELTALWGLYAPLARLQKGRMYPTRILYGCRHGALIRANGGTVDPSIQVVYLYFNIKFPRSKNCIKRSPVFLSAGLSCF